MIKITHGKIRGNTIELAEDSGLDEGQEAEVQINIPGTRKWGDGILRTAGALASDPYWDAIMVDIHQSRKMGRAPQTQNKG